MSGIAWKVLATVSGIAAGKAATKVTTSVWKTATGNKPPTGRYDPEFSAMQVAVFTLVSTAVTAGFKAFAQRKAADYYTRSAGTLPPPMLKAQQKAADKAKADAKASARA
ncbi:DUF4235 domain-containing protein [Flexivirga caeni]|nr:DUF4235 domain-containing protein [Flexivirga caeni]